MTEINLDKSSVRELNEKLQGGSAGDAFSSGIFLAELKISISVSLFQFLSFFDTISHST